MKKFLVMSILTTIVIGGANGLAAFADDNKPVTQTVDVSYEPSIVVGNDDYCVILPKAISFKADDREVDTSVHLANKNGSTYSGAAITVKGSVTSANSFKLQCEKGKDCIPYELKYGSTVLSGSGGEIGTLSNTAKDLTGSAILPKSSEANRSGAHTDTLTYTFTKSK